MLILVKSEDKVFRNMLEVRENSEPTSFSNVAKALRPGFRTRLSLSETIYRVSVSMVFTFDVYFTHTFKSRHKESHLVLRRYWLSALACILPSVQHVIDRTRGCKSNSEIVKDERAHATHFGII